MALCKTITADNGLEAPNAYHRVTEVQLVDKRHMTFVLASHAGPPQEVPGEPLPDGVRVDPRRVQDDPDAHPDDFTGEFDVSADWLEHAEVFDTLEQAEARAEELRADGPPEPDPVVREQPVVAIDRHFCAYDMDGANPLAQAYDYLKDGPLEGAVDC